MPPTVSCPNRETLRQLLLGQLAGNDSNQLADHLEHCPQCTALVGRLNAEDTLVEAARSSATASDGLDAKVVLELIARFSGSAPQLESHTGSTTIAGPRLPITANPKDEMLAFLTPPQAPGELGRLGQYRIIKVLGAGGMGMVFQAEEPELKRLVALKVMKPEVADKHGARERFLREAQAAAQLEHEHVVTIFQVGEANGVPFIAMQWLKGESLEDRLKRAPAPSIPETLRIGRQAARGLAAAHDRGLIHRDIKPANIWLESKDDEGAAHVRLLDFGLARPASDNQHLTQSGAIVGTPSYMAPEQGRGQTVDHRCDLFSLGVILYQMATSRKPFTGSDMMAVLTSLAVDHPPAPNAVNPRVPPPLSTLVMRLLEKNPAARPASAKEVARVLADIEKQIEQTAIPVAAPVVAAADPWADIDFTEAVTPAPVAANPPLQLSPLKDRGRKKSRWPLVAAALLILIGGGFAAYQLIFKTKDGTLIVEVDGDADVRFQKGELRIHNAKGELKYTLKPSEKNRTLPAGYYRVDLRGADGLKVETSEFVLERGGNATVRVRADGAVLAKNKATTKKTANDPDRRIADWVLSMGGRIEIRINGVVREVNQPRELPADPFALIAINLSTIRDITDSHMKQLKELEKLTTLLLYATSISDAGVSQLVGLRSLIRLDLGGTRVSDAALSDLKKLPDLQVLYLYGTRVSDAGMVHLKDFPALRDLRFDGTDVGDAGVKQIAGLTDLEYLHFGASRITNAGLGHLKQLTRLIHLNVDETEIGDAGLVHLSGMSRLRYLHLMKTQITDAGVSKLTPLKELRALFLKETSIGDDALKQLRNFSHLEHLDVFDTKVSANGVANLHRSLSTCTIISHHGTFDATKAPNNPDRRAAEWALGIGGKVTIFIDDKELQVEKAQDLPAKPFGVIDLNLAEVAKFKDADLANLDGLTALLNLWLGKTPINDVGLEHLKVLKRLHLLYLNETKITDAGLIHLKALPNLGELKLDDTSVTGKGLEHIAAIPALDVLFMARVPIDNAGLAHLKKAPALTWLGIRETPITDGAIEHLMEMKKLKVLDIEGTRITAEAVKKLVAALPNCKIMSDHGTFGPKK